MVVGFAVGDTVGGFVGSAVGTAVQSSLQRTGQDTLKSSSLQAIKSVDSDALIKFLHFSSSLAQQGLTQIPHVIGHSAAKFCTVWHDSLQLSGEFSQIAQPALSCQSGCSQQ
jgi:hypothetical protein